MSHNATHTDDDRQQSPANFDVSDLSELEVDDVATVKFQATDDTGDVITDDGIIREDTITGTVTLKMGDKLGFRPHGSDTDYWLASNLVAESGDGEIFGTSPTPVCTY